MFNYAFSTEEII